jgi:8-oxo-dGTP diphosphatase
MPYTYKYPQIAVTVDAIVFRAGEAASVLLIKRGQAPFEGEWALPGGFVEVDETGLNAAHRELAEETGLRGVDLTFLHYFDAVDRDPRHRTLSLAFWGVVENGHIDIRGADDATEARWHALAALPDLAFDHAEILARAVNAWRASTAA